MNVLTAPQNKEKFFTRGLLLQLGFLLGISGVMTYAALSADKEFEKLLPESKVVSSTYNTKPSGISALHELFEEVFGSGSGAGKRKIVRWETPYRKLVGGTVLPKVVDATRRKEILPPVKGVLIIVRPDEALADFEVEELLAWVKEGNSLVYLDDFRFHFSRRLLEKIGLGIERFAKPIENALSDENKDETIAPLFTHLRVLRLSANEHITAGKPLVTVDGHTIVAQKSYGHGKILVGSAPNMLSNKLVNKAENWANFQFFSNWISQTEGGIYFDETCHGYKNGASVIVYFMRGPAGLVILQIGIILLIGIVSQHQRFGSILRFKNPRKIASSEYISGLANTYSRAQARKAALEIIYQSLKNRLCKLLAISPHEPVERLLESLATNQGRLHESGEAKEISTLIHSCEAALAADFDLGQQAFNDLVLACDKISRKIDKQESRV